MTHFLKYSGAHVFPEDLNDFVHHSHSYIFFFDMVFSNFHLVHFRSNVSMDARTPVLPRIIETRNDSAHQETHARTHSAKLALKHEWLSAPQAHAHGLTEQSARLFTQETKKLVQQGNSYHFDRRCLYKPVHVRSPGARTRFNRTVGQVVYSGDEEVSSAGEQLPF